MLTNTQFALGVHMLTLLAALSPATLSSEVMAESANFDLSSGWFGC